MATAPNVLVKVIDSPVQVICRYESFKFKNQNLKKKQKFLAKS